MGYIDSSLTNGEEVLSRFNINKYSLMAPYFLFVFAFSILLFGTISPGGIPPMIYFGVAVITFAAGLVMFIQIKSLEYGITNQRVIKKKGIIARNTEEIINKAVETIEVKQSIFGRMFGFGNVVVTGRGNSMVVFESVDEPLRVKREIETAVFDV